MRGLSTQSAPEPQFFDQKVDHFDESSSATFKQRYWVSDAGWAGTATTPTYLFLYMCGEATCPGSPHVNTTVMALARRYHAAVLTLEHRFYGNSIPNNDTSVKGLRYLSVQQSLADNAAVMQWYPSHAQGWGSTTSAPPPWVVFGGSYSGALAAWFKETYPNLAVAAYSSSGVVNSILDFSQFDSRVGKAVSQSCAEVLHRTTLEIETLLDQSPQTVKGLFGASHLRDIDFLFMVADSAAMTVQYSQKSALCNFMMNASASGVSLAAAFANFTSTHWGPSFGGSCAYDTQCLAANQPNAWDARSWYWQVCTELGWMQTAPRHHPLRSPRLTLGALLKQCAQIFGRPMLPVTVLTNFEFGGARPRAHRCLYVDASDDPWQEASVDHSVTPSQPYFYIHCEDCGHCIDLREPKPTDPPQLTAARQAIQNKLDEWLLSAEK